MTKTAITPTRTENYPEWYLEVIKAAELAENSPVRGCMIIRPWGYAIWENIQSVLDKQFKATGHENAYFPLLIPLSYFEKEAAHVEGFAKECAVVTHTRLQAGTEPGTLIPGGALEEPFVIRPTSETIIGEYMSRHVQSHRDLPLKLNQWANVMRWELRTRLFLRSSEFLWQEGHTAHATEQEAREETLQMLDVYVNFIQDYLAVPVIKGEKTASERFPGASNTYTVESMMQDKKALQAGTSHFLGQNFAKASGIKFTNHEGVEQLAWTTSWGVTTRLIGALIMTHSDDDGFVLPPRIAPAHIVIMPIYRSNDERTEVLAYCQHLRESLQSMHYHENHLRVILDDSENRGKAWTHIKRGVPVRLEIGPRDIANDHVFMARRDHAANQKTSIDRKTFLNNIMTLLDEMQDHLFKKAVKMRHDHTREIHSLDDFKQFFANDGGFALCYAVDEPIVEEHIKPLSVSARCLPLDQQGGMGICIFTGKQTNQRVIFAKAY